MGSPEYRIGRVAPLRVDALMLRLSSISLDQLVGGGTFRLFEDAGECSVDCLANFVYVERSR